MRVNSFIGFAFKTLLVFSFLLSSSYAFGALLNLAWDANTESDLAGYKIYYGTSSGQYGTPKDAGNVTTYALTGLTAGTTYFIAATAYDTSGNESTKSNEVSGVAADASQTITVTTNPAGRQIVVDGTTYTAPQTFTWVVDSQHTLNVSSPQSGSTGTRFVFSSWSDGGAQSHTITTPSASTTYTANFTTQYSLSSVASPSAGGTVSPSGTNWYNSGQNVSISATAGSGYAFSGWTGDLTGTTNPASLVMNGTKSVTATFTLLTTGPSYIITTSPAGRQITVDGTNYTAPQTFNWSAGSSHTIAVSSPQNGSSGTRYAFSSWSDGGAQSHTVTAPASSTTYTVTFTTQYRLTTAVSPSGGGTVSPSGTNWYNSGQSVSMSATASSNYSFAGWSGNLTGSANPASLTMSGPKSISAQFNAAPETIATPTRPSGPSTGNAGTAYSYIASGASSNLGHSLQYQFDWKGDGTDLSIWGAANQQKSWSTASTYNVRVRARCSSHTSVVSNWSPATLVTIQGTYQISCADGGIQCLDRTDGGDDSDNLVNGKPKVDLEYEFKIVLRDTGGAPQYVKLWMTQRSNPQAADFYDYDMSCNGDYTSGANCTYRTKLGPASVHKFYFTAKLSGGTIISYPSSGYITGPQIQLLTGNYHVGAPRDINSASLNGQQALGSSRVYRWQADGQVYTRVTNSDPVKVGEGYSLYKESRGLPELATYGEVPGLEYIYRIYPGLNLISNPYSGNVKLSDVKVQKGTQPPVSWQAAVTNGWVVNALYYYNGKDWGDTYSHETAEDGAVMVPWLGYWVDLNSTDDAYYLVIPKP